MAENTNFYNEFVATFVSMAIFESGISTAEIVADESFNDMSPYSRTIYAAYCEAISAQVNPEVVMGIAHANYVTDRMGTAPY